MYNNSFTVNISNQIKSYKKSIRVDSDKSISIRSFIIGATSLNISKVNNALESEDVFSCITSLKRFGIKISKTKAKQYLIFGKGLGSLKIKRNSSIDFGNSGTLARLLTGLLSTTPNIKVQIKGDKSLNKRNMLKLINLLTRFGASFYPKKKSKFPLTLVSSEMPVGINYEAGVSAQLKSAVILAGLNAYGTTNIFERKKSRDHTENMLLQNNKVLKIKKNNIKQNCIKILGKKQLKPININVPGDPSSAAFFTALTLTSSNALLKIKRVGLNPRRIGFYNLLKKHGAKIKFKNRKKINN